MEAVRRRMAEAGLWESGLQSPPPAGLFDAKKFADFFRYYNPNNPNHPPIELCHNCNQLGRILDYCMFQPLPASLLPGRR